MLILHGPICLSVYGGFTGNCDRNNHTAWRQKLLFLVSCYTFTATQLVSNEGLEKTSFFLVEPSIVRIAFSGFIHYVLLEVMVGVDV